VAFRIYKPGQGRYVRLGTAGGVGVVGLVLCWYLWVLLNRYLPDSPAKIYLEYGVPALVFALIAVAAAWYLNTPKVADFLIATESEMKKVSWSSKAEVLGSTMVVIVTVVLLALFIYVTDTLVTFSLDRVLNIW